MRRAQMKIESNIGNLYLVASSDGLQGIHFKKQDVPYVRGVKDECYVMLQLAAGQLKEYFKGERKDFDIPLEMIGGTPFQRKVWKELSNIKYGETISYKDLAVAVGHANAYRAVGSANGKNPIAVIIPCHRVIAHDKTLGGYGGGLDLKSVLLELEKN